MARSALVMVTRGEAALVERAMRSVRPFVDEMVILDLGAPAEAADAWREIGARVVPGQWSTDAAACRNAALDAADADWNLVLEAEEWLASGIDALRLLVERPPECVGLVEIHRAIGGVHEADHPRYLAPRLLPRGVRYEGARHEEPVFDLPAEHVGVVLRSDDVEAARWRADHTLAEALLHQALAVRPGDAGLLLDLADELRVSARFAEASEHYTAALLATPTVDEKRHAVVVGALEAYTKAGRLREAVALLDAEATRWQHSPDLAFLAGDLFFEMLLTSAVPAPELVTLAETSWLRCLDLGERPGLSGAVHGRGSFLAAQNLGVLFLVLGQGEESQRWADRAGELRLSTPSVGGPLG
ncbi:hypothetical protein [Mobilicoccus pelagius]|uniref:Glycosyltransferase n=1 Tax=Mobilicoccus pelagius NBRC 104925 TaxID=1089455 RepID=H5UP45_9MICO|nr:hypothetical protein [Mobilicoccus pelagius]GAB47503.1 hypothetical protein MOPEL_016_00060 [Mobilicoccus pelagius NBRC 104925]